MFKNKSTYLPILKQKYLCFQKRAVNHLEQFFTFKIIVIGNLFFSGGLPLSSYQAFTA